MLAWAASIRNKGRVRFVVRVGQQVIATERDFAACPAGAWPCIHKARHVICQFAAKSKLGGIMLCRLWKRSVEDNPSAAGSAGLEKEPNHFRGGMG